MINENEELILDCLSERDKYYKLKDYVVEIELKKSINLIIKRFDRKLNKLFHQLKK